MFNKKSLIILFVSFFVIFISKTYAIDFVLTDVNNVKHSNKDHKGQYLIVNFWATWCPPCLEEIPAFVKFREKYKGKVEILGLNYQDITLEGLKDFMESHDMEYPVFPAEVINDFTQFDNVEVMPTTLIYDREGNLIKKFLGELSIDDLKKVTIDRDKDKPFFSKVF